jgi:lysozyme family protein
MPEVLVHEGGYADHPSDPGGATKYGITIGTLSSWRGRQVSKAEVRALTIHEAARILEVRYWKPVKADALPQGVDYALFDFAINSGPSRAVKHLQNVLGVKMDGIVGPDTLRAAGGREPAAIITQLCDARVAFLRGLSAWRTFGKGWTARVAKVRATALQLAGTAAVPLPGDMPDVAPTPPAPGGRRNLIKIIIALIAASSAAIAAWLKFGG